MIANYENHNEEFETLIKIVGEDKAIEIMQTMGGVNVYIPKFKTFSRKERNNQIFNDYLAGMKFKKIALKYNLTADTIKRIISRMESMK